MHLFPYCLRGKQVHFRGFPVLIPTPPSTSPRQHPASLQPILPGLPSSPVHQRPAEKRKCVGGLNKYPVVPVVAAGKVDNLPNSFHARALPVCALFQNPAVHFRTIGKHPANPLHPPPLSQLFNSPRQKPCGFPHRFVKTSSPPASTLRFRNPRPPQQTPLPHLPQTPQPPAKNPPAIRALQPAQAHKDPEPTTPRVSKSPQKFISAAAACFAAAPALPAR